MNGVEIKGLCKSYGKIKAVDGLDLVVESGQVFGLLGPNGSGKTTTIKLLLGLIKQDSGDAFVLGRSISKGIELERIGYMPQETALYEELTVHENLKLFGGIFGMKKGALLDREEEVLGIVDLKGRRDSLLSELSGGQRHRISLAVTLLHSPDILFLDEPTVGVDPPLRVSFWKTFHDLKRKGVTIIMTTHYLDEARKCDNIGLMRSGKLISKGSPERIMKDTGTDNLEDAFLKLASARSPEVFT